MKYILEKFMRIYILQLLYDKMTKQILRENKRKKKKRKSVYQKL